MSIVDARNDKHDFTNKPEKYDYMYTEVECVNTSLTRTCTNIINQDIVTVDACTQMLGWNMSRKTVNELQ